MVFSEINKLWGFYQNELKNNILGFWLPRCVDREEGGFVNCFDNRGEKLVSHDKYAWSQGRFVWLFARLAVTEAPIFTQEERRQFLALAEHGAEFLMRHSLMGPDDWRVVFLMDRSGAPKEVTPGAPLDMSIYADCFVILGCAMYAYASKRTDVYEFAHRLYQSVKERVERGEFRTLPYPLSDRFRAHGIPMILSNVARELLRAAQVLDPRECDGLKGDMERFTGDTLEHFVDENYVLHEILTRENQFFPQILGQHMNPGHTIEDAWFMLDTADICGRADWENKIFAVVRRALSNGWDGECGGILHFTGINGGKPQGDDTGVEEEPMTRQLSGWDDKLWWIHSEALYTTLLCYFRTGDQDFLDWHDKVFDYCYRVFPNPDPEIREWIQILRRDGTPQDKVVALPVKDPFHIARNLILILELLYREREKALKKEEIRSKGRD